MPLPDVLPPGISLHRLELDLQADFRAAWPDLTPAERERAGRYRLDADRIRFTQTRATVRRLLAERLGCAPADVPLVQTPNGKPCLAFNGHDLAGALLFNVSHAGHHALIALADPARVAQLGVDIEEEGDGLDSDGVLELAFTAQEREALRHCANHRRAAFARWVGKEAVLKAVGTGIADDLRAVGIRPCANGRLEIDASLPACRGIEAVALPAPHGYAAALAWRSKD